MNDYKGIYYGDNTEQHYYEGGAHFKYSELVQKLEALQVKMQPPTQKIRTRNSQQNQLYQSNTTNAKAFLSFTNKENKMLSQYILGKHNLTNRGRNDSKKKLLSMTKTTMSNTRNSNGKENLTSNTLIKNGYIPKNRHVSLEVKKKEKDKKEKTPTNHNNSTSKNKRAAEYSIKVKKFNMKGTKINPAHNSVSKYQDKSKGKAKESKEICDIEKEKGSLTQRTKSITSNKSGNKTTNKKSRNAHYDSMSFKSSSIDHTKKNLSMTRTTYQHNNYGNIGHSTLKIYNYKKKNGTINVFNKENYAQLYLRKNILKSACNVKREIPSNPATARENGKHRKISPLMYQHI